MYDVCYVRHFNATPFCVSMIQVSTEASEGLVIDNPPHEVAPFSSQEVKVRCRMWEAPGLHRHVVHVHNMDYGKTEEVQVCCRSSWSSCSERLSERKKHHYIMELHVWMVYHPLSRGASNSVPLSLFSQLPTLLFHLRPLNKRQLSFDCFVLSSHCAVSFLAITPRVC